MKKKKHVREGKRKTHTGKEHSFERTVKKIIQLILNPRFLLCFGLAWMITNGWSYILLGLGVWLNIGWMTAVATAYLAILWIPITPEKIITIALSLIFLRAFFPQDEKTLGTLKEMREKIKRKKKEKKEEEEGDKND